MLTTESYERIKAAYWVLAFPNELAAWMDWLFSPNIAPSLVPNPSMTWRRPTYEEAIIRQRAYENDPERFIKLCDKYSKREYDMGAC